MKVVGAAAAVSLSNEVLSSSLFSRDDALALAAARRLPLLAGGLGRLPPSAPPPALPPGRTPVLLLPEGGVNFEFEARRNRRGGSGCCDLGALPVVGAAATVATAAVVSFEGISRAEVALVGRESSSLLPPPAANSPSKSRPVIKALVAECGRSSSSPSLAAGSFCPGNRSVEGTVKASFPSEEERADVC